jgi:hypothetical protein
VVYEQCVTETEKCKLLNKLNFLENKRDYAACLKNIVTFLVA